MKGHIKKFQFITFRTESELILSLYILDSTKKDGFIRVYDETRYLVLLGSEKNDSFMTRLDIL